MVKIRFRKNVYLTKSEYDELLKLYGQTAVDYIERLSNHITATNKKYSSHFETLKEWLNKDQVAPKGKPSKNAYGEYDGDNQKELEQLRREHHIQVCPFCKRKFKLRKMLKWEIGKTPHAIYDCECGASGYEEIIIENGQKMVYCGGDDRNMEWNENTIKERLEKDITVTFNEKYGKE